MTRGIKALIELDVFNTYFDAINGRIKASGTGRLRLYVGDCVSYTFQLFKNNGWSPEVDSPNEVYEVLQNVLCLCFQANGIDGRANWSDDLNYIYVSGVNYSV